MAAWCVAGGRFWGVEFQSEEFRDGKLSLQSCFARLVTCYQSSQLEAS